jgi:predicted 3-demethylubiquinone-9 3-methyltransferase (glyoxalase superfamily)
MITSKIKPFLWYNTQAEEAAKLYCSIFPNAQILKVVPGPTGGPMIVEFVLDGFPMLALNGGPQHHFNEAVSFVIHCETQAEIDHYWEKLGVGGVPGQCGWLKDRFGVSWQVIPSLLPQWMADEEKFMNVMAVLWGMTKIEIAPLQAAFDLFEE